MPRRSRSTHTRDTPNIARADTLSLIRARLFEAHRLSNTFLRELEDRRTFSPEIARPARGVRRDATRLMVSPNVNKPVKATEMPTVPTGVQFADPRRVAICMRRKTRREVIFARGSGGGRKRKHRRAKWSEFSTVRC